MQVLRTKKCHHYMIKYYNFESNPVRSNQMRTPIVSH